MTLDFGVQTFFCFFSIAGVCFWRTGAAVKAEQSEPTGAALTAARICRIREQRSKKNL
jgi:hypothetical protein